MLHSKELRNYTNSQPHSEGSNSNSERAGPLLRSPTRTLLRVPRAAFTANKPIKRAMKHCNRCGLHAFASPTPPFWLQALMNSGAVASGVARGFFLPIVFISFLPCFFTSYYVFFFFFFSELSCSSLTGAFQPITENDLPWPAEGKNSYLPPGHFWIYLLVETSCYSPLPFRHWCLVKVSW